MDMEKFETLSLGRPLSTFQEAIDVLLLKILIYIYIVT